MSKNVVIPKLLENMNMVLVWSIDTRTKYSFCLPVEILMNLSVEILDSYKLASSILSEGNMGVLKIKGK